MYRNGEFPGNYYPGGTHETNGQANNGWYWDGTQYQQYYYSQEGGAAPAPPDLVAIPNEEEETPNDGEEGLAIATTSSGGAGGGGSVTTHEEHYAFYEKQLDNQLPVQPPDVLQRGDAVVPSSDRNLFMETGHLDAVDVPPIDRLVLGENEDTRFVPGISSTDEQQIIQQQGVPRSEAVGADRQEEENISIHNDPSPPPPVLRNVEGGGDEDSKPQSEGDEPEEEEEEEEQRDNDHKDTRRSKGEPSSSSGRSNNHHNKKRDKDNRRRRNYSPEEDRRTNRRRDERQTVSPPSSDEYQRGPSRRNSRRYSSKYSNNKSYRGNDYYDEHASMRSDRSYVEDRRRSHHQHNRSTYYDYPSRPSSRASNYEFDYSRSTRRHYPHDQYYGNTYGPAAAPMPDPAILESFRKNWEYYSRNPAQMEALRISNPIQHATLLRYYQMYSHLLPAAKPITSSQSQVSDQQQNGMRPSSRNSVHSGQSSVVENFPCPLDQSSPSGPPVGEDNENKYDKSVVSSDPADVTPLKYCAPHVNGSFGAHGILALVNAKNPAIGQSASVDLIPLAKKMSEDVPSHMRNLKEFPGPLIPGRTHKGEVIRFCQNKISAASGRKDIVDKDSYILLWELLILLLRQKNAIDGSDIAELLLKDRAIHEELSVNVNGKKSLEDEEDIDINIEEEDHSSSDDELVYSPSQECQAKVTSKFRDYLLYGHKIEGLEYAMKHGLWGHALFLASKMDERSYSNVMVRFANGISVSDPIQTLYQQMSGRQPIAMKECAESNWGDWRPHLAMILSNPSKKSGLDHKSIMTLGDTLYEKGYLYASQFCYLMINLDFGYYSDGVSSKLVLIGADHLVSKFKAFTSNVEAVQCTEIFEYVQKLSHSDSGGINSFIFYKYLYTLRLLDFGCTSTALHYLEIIAETISKKINDGSQIKCDYLETKHFINQVLYLADRLKYLDPKYTTAEGEKSEIGDPEWLLKFREVVVGMQYQTMTTPEFNNDYQFEKQNQPDYQQQQEELQPQIQSNHHQPDQQQKSQYTQVEYNGQMYYYDTSTGQYYLIQNEQIAPVVQENNTIETTNQDSSSYIHKTELQSSMDSLDSPPMMKPLQEKIPTPHISRQDSLSDNHTTPLHIMPQIYTTVNEDKGIPPPSKTATSQPQQKIQPPKEDPSNKSKNFNTKSGKSGGSGLFGRIFGRLVAPPNQVHLPEDNDESIVWDEKKKRWIDSSDNTAEEEAYNAPPPSDSDLLSKSSNRSSNLPGPPGSNRFSGKGAKGLRGRVDVFKNSMSAPSLNTLALAPPLDPTPIVPPTFAPSIEETSGTMDPEENNAPPTYSEATDDSNPHSSGGPPMFYNPSQFQTMANVGKTRRNKYV
uniref:Sec16 Sec23-binding domain-containing protein n=1 Tax=Lepeophtheirus salmonis TaxID=72036 RepID=A0A0K2V1V9_LEPSM